MNRKISLAVGTAAAVAFTGVASASDLLTINETEGYASEAAGAAFTSVWVLGECHAGVDETNTTGCPDHGEALVMQAAGLVGNFWSGGDAVPAFTHTPADSWRLVGPTGDNPFMSGIFYRPTEGTGSSYFDGLARGWLTPGDAVAAHGRGSTALSMGIVTAGAYANITLNEEWVDQIVVTYVESFEDLDNDGNPDPGGATTLVQNFRQQFNQTGTDVTDPDSATDFRLEQMVELGQAEGEASRQTFQQALADDGSNGALNGPFGQLVSQDVEGFFLSCINCDNGETPGHAFTPNFLDAQYQPYMDIWSEVPTITHGGI